MGRICPTNIFFALFLLKSCCVVLSLYVKINLLVEAKSSPFSSSIYLFHPLLPICLNLITDVNSQPAWSPPDKQHYYPRVTPGTVYLVNSTLDPKHTLISYATGHIYVHFICVCDCVRVAVKRHRGQQRTCLFSCPTLLSLMPVFEVDEVKVVLDGRNRNGKKVISCVKPCPFRRLR